LTVQLLALWRFGAHRHDKSAATKIIDAIAQKMGSYPPKAFCTFIFSKFNAQLPEHLTFNEGAKGEVVKTEKGRITFRHGTFEIIIYYSSMDDGHDKIVFRDRKSGNIRWDHVLFGCGVRPIDQYQPVYTGPSVRRTFYCNVVDDFVYIFGSSGSGDELPWKQAAFFEQFQISTGKRVAVFATSNWWHP
jgi:hypothetical protein